MAYTHVCIHIHMYIMKQTNRNNEVNHEAFAIWKNKGIPDTEAGESRVESRVGSYVRKALHKVFRMSIFCNIFPCWQRGRLECPNLCWLPKNTGSNSEALQSVWLGPEVHYNTEMHTPEGKFKMLMRRVIHEVACTATCNRPRTGQPALCKTLETDRVIW